MPSRKDKALADFRRALRWIVLLAIATVAGALAFLGASGELSTHTVIATILGVFFSMLLGCGLFALAFFSDKSGHDDSVTNSTRRRDGEG